MRRETQNLVLLLIGVSVVMIAVTGHYTRYVKPALLPWLGAAAAVLLILALAAMIRDIRRGPHQQDRPHQHDGHPDGHAHRGRVIWLLVLPIVLLIFIVPPPLSPRAAAPVALGAPGQVVRRAFPALPAGRAPTVALPQVLMRIATDSTDGLDGRLITVTGFTMKDGDHVDLAKIVIICCAADAQLARLSLAGPAARAAADLPENTWISVEGTVPPGQHYTGTASIPVLEVSSVVPIAPPANTYGS